MGTMGKSHIFMAIFPHQVPDGIRIQSERRVHVAGAQTASKLGPLAAQHLVKRFLNPRSMSGQCGNV